MSSLHRSREDAYSYIGFNLANPLGTSLWVEEEMYCQSPDSNAVAW